MKNFSKTNFFVLALFISFSLTGCYGGMMVYETKSSHKPAPAPQVVHKPAPKVAHHKVSPQPKPSKLTQKPMQASLPKSFKQGSGGPRR